MLIVLDTETTGLSYINDKIIGLAYCGEKLSSANYKLWKDIKKEDLKKYLLKDESIYHNAKFDLHMMHAVKLPLPVKFHDTMLITNLLEEQGRHNLEAVCKKYCNIEPWKAELQDWLKDNDYDKGQYDKVPFELLCKYGKQDSMNTMILFQKTYPMLLQAGLLPLYTMEIDLCRALVEIEARGIPVDVKLLKKIGKAFEKEREILGKEVYSIVGYEFNIASDDELIKALYETLKLPVTYVSPKTKKPSTDKDTLSCYDHPVIKPLMAYRNRSYLISTFCVGIPERAEADGTLRTEFNQIGASTGRFSSANPNLQNIEKKSDIRKAFLVRKGFTNYYFDYSQMELMVYANFSKDPVMCKAFEENRDIHTEMTCLFYNRKEVTDAERALIKGLNFGILYGLGAAGIMRKFRKTKTEAWDILNRYRSTFPVMRSYNQRINDQAKHDGVVRNPFGRMRRLEPDKAYRAVNTLVQGTCADIMRSTMVRVHELLKKHKAKSGILITIHDELVIEIAKGEEKLIPLIKIEMENCPQFPMALKVDIKCTKTNWFDKASYKEVA